MFIDMDMPEVLSDLNVWHLLFFILPGFVSLKIFSMIHSNEEVRLKDQIFEAIFFGVINFGIMFPAFIIFINMSSPSILLWWLFALAYLLLVPTGIAFLLSKIRLWTAERGLATYIEKLPWDDFFLRREHCWIIAHLRDGRRIGGKFWGKSRASLYPNSGYLYIEELWTLDDSGAFLKAVSQSKGVILRPDDYSFIEIFSAE